MNVVIVGGCLPYPANTGSRIRSLNLACRLAARHRVTYVAPRPADPAEGDAARDYLEGQGVRVVTVEHTVPRKKGPAFYARLAANLASPHPYAVASHLSPALTRAVRELARG